MLESIQKSWVYRVCQFILSPGGYIIVTLHFRCAPGALGRFWPEDIVNKVTNLSQKSSKRTLPSGGFFSFSRLNRYAAEIKQPKCGSIKTTEKENDNNGN